MKTSKFTYISAVFILFSLTLHGQVVTPSMNPTTPVQSPAAAGWKTKSSIGTTYFDRIGSRTYDGQDVYEFAGSGYSGGFHLEMGERMALNARYYDDTTTVEKDQPYPGEVNIKTTISQANISLSHEDFAVFGIGMRTYQTQDYINDAFDETVTETATIPSMSIKIGGLLYIGAGVEIVKETGSETVNNHWINNVAGVAIMTDKTDGFQFRVEASAMNSPSAEATPKQDLGASLHNETNVARGALELQYKGLVFEAFTVDTRETVDKYDASADIKISEIRSVTTQYGFLIAPDDGLVLGFHFRTDKVEDIHKDQLDSFVISLAYNFGGGP